MKIEEKIAENDPTLPSAEAEVASDDKDEMKGDEDKIEKDEREEGQAESELIEESTSTSTSSVHSVILREDVRVVRDSAGKSKIFLGLQ